MDEDAAREAYAGRFETRRPTHRRAARAMNLIPPVVPDTVHFGDCLEVMSRWRPEQVDLIYLDPPFHSQRDYRLTFARSADDGGRRRKAPAFEDTWRWDADAAKRVRELTNRAGKIADAVEGVRLALGPSGMLAYLAYMAERLAEAKRVLKPTGSIYLHCDPAASHYLKVVMDAVFGAGNFRNEIVWRIGWVSGFKTRKRGWIRNHDTILYYGNGGPTTFHKEYLPYPEGYRRRGERGKPTGPGIPLEDTWNCSAADRLDSIMITSFSREKLGYPTQKPEALLRRIIRASSDEGDLVLDPFCGCGTTMAAALKENRRWAGIEVSPFAVSPVVENRLRPLVGGEVNLAGFPTRMEEAERLAEHDRARFEAWAVNLVFGMAPSEGRTGDGGIEGRGEFLGDIEGFDYGGAVARVESGTATMDSVLTFARFLDDPDSRAVAGVFITRKPTATAGMKAAAAKLGSFRLRGSAKEYPRFSFWSVEEHFAGIRPDLPPLADPVTGRERQVPLRTLDPDA